MYVGLIFWLTTPLFMCITSKLNLHRFWESFIKNILFARIYQRETGQNNNFFHFVKELQTPTSSSPSSEVRRSSVFAKTREFEFCKLLYFKISTFLSNTCLFPLAKAAKVSKVGAYFLQATLRVAFFAPFHLSRCLCKSTFSCTSHVMLRKNPFSNSHKKLSGLSWLASSSYVK